MAEVNSPFGRLPAEMKMYIFEFLELNDKMSARQVCHFWSELISCIMKFSTQLQDNCVKQILNSNVEFEKLTVSRLSNTSLPCSFQRNNFMRCLKKLTLRNDAVGISEMSLLKLLRLSDNILKLTIQTSTLKNAGLVLWNSLPFERLEILKLQLFTYERNHHKAVQCLLDSATFPKLYIFSFEFTNTSKCQGAVHKSVYPARPFQQIYIGAMEFIRKHKKTLTYFFLCEPLKLIKCDGAFAFESDIPREVAETEDIVPINIKHMSLFFGVYDILNPICFLSSFSFLFKPKSECNFLICTNFIYDGISLISKGSYLMSANNSLKSLHICGHPLSNDLQIFVSRNKNTLESMSWISDTLLNVQLPPSFDMGNLEGTTTLKILYLCTSQILNLRAIPTCLTQLAWASPISLEDLLWLSRNLPNVECFSLEDCFQLETIYDIPFITLPVFKKILALPKLVILNLSCLSSISPINNFCSKNSGLYYSRICSVITISIDRSNFNPEILS